MNEVNRCHRYNQFFHSEMNFMNKILIKNFNYASFYRLFKFQVQKKLPQVGLILIMG